MKKKKKKKKKRMNQNDLVNISKSIRTTQSWLIKLEGCLHGRSSANNLHPIFILTKSKYNTQFLFLTKSKYNSYKKNHKPKFRIQTNAVFL